MTRRQGVFRFRTWGGARKGAGRKPTGDKAGMPHVARPRLAAAHPVHVTMRVERSVPRLRRHRAYECVARALVRMIRRDDFRVVHVSIQATHLHLLCEAQDERALSRGVRAFEISVARRINRACGRRGRVFADRYHAEAITTPRRARHALAYVLNNWRRHREDAARGWRIDPFSSAITFDGWRGEEATAGWRLPRGYDALPVRRATSWLLATGWRRHGRVRLDERPGPPL
jgi:REP element-mobilizing transposase RayT